MTLGKAAAFFLVAALAGAVLWHRRLPFWARVALTLLGALGMFLTRFCCKARRLTIVR